MKKLMMVMGVWMFSLVGMAQAQEINEQNPYELVKGVASKTFDRIKANQEAVKADPEMLRTIMEEELVPHIDYKFAAFMVLGKHFKSVPQEKMGEYITVFRQYLITSYAVAMGYYDNQTVQFEPESSFSDKKSVTVRAVVQDPKRPEIKIAFKVRKDSKTNEWKAYDMVAEGISMLNSKRSEFESILRQDGIDAVIALMREKIGKPVELNQDEPIDFDGETA
ncbi:ABC transporter substrate-binding protein [Alteromonas stellipolaris]|uniref:ABC transporter substrate-binding protein n=2 Tax=Alteromonas TaxID=226 RepID=A0AAW7Z006_9ALTE|nr:MULTISPECIES: ABC transporter substrate-binding protein [Alteromonas]AMJ89710.1 toluene tolerance protein [Alteromonas sp. Mac2]ALM91729.1 putative ABC transporter, auxiliary component YrbC [Alteromonas stellipolaris LMG 21856]AMJ73409.1 toluene tolerance protein [Alteromonas stellipolaris]AMJ85852.1 toluene tolerance protein [Alteromonas sp. Mac1]AMJ93528.1 toluene tolerance protein [Alteromonas stellipolaris]